MSPHALFLTLLTFFPLLYASVFLHELGHAVAGRAVGFVVTSFGLGMARPWLVIKCGRVKIYLCWVRPFQGLTFVVMPQLYPSKGQKVLFAAGGVFANALAALLALTLLRWCAWGRGVWLLAAVVNGLLGGINLIPIQTRVGETPLRTDGVLILAALRSKSFHPPAPMIIQSVKSLRRLWESTGDQLQIKLGLFRAAGSYAALDDFERAELLRVEGESLPPFEEPVVLAAGALVHGLIAAGTGRIEEATEAFDLAEAHYRSLRHDVGLLLVAALRSGVQIRRDDAPGAAAALELLMSHDLVTCHPQLRIALLVSLLTARVAMSDDVGVENTLAGYEALRRGEVSPSIDLQVYKIVARFHAQKGEWARAEPAYRRVVAAINELALAWLDPMELARFLEVQSALLAEAGQCLHMLGKSDEAERLVVPLTSLEEVKRRLDGALLERDRRLRRAGLRILLLNVASFFGLSMLNESTGPSFFKRFVILEGMLGLFILAELSYLLFQLAVGRHIPALRRGSGGVILLLACIPWLSVILIIFGWLSGATPV